MSDEEKNSDDTGFDADALAALARPSGAPPAMEDDDGAVLDLRALAASAAPPAMEEADAASEEGAPTPDAASEPAAASSPADGPAARNEEPTPVAAQPAPSGESKGGAGLWVGLGIGLAAAAAVFFATRGGSVGAPQASANPPTATGTAAPAAAGTATPSTKVRAAAPAAQGPEGEQGVASDGTPASDQAPASDRAPASDQAPASDRAPASDQSPASDQASASDQAPAHGGRAGRHPPRHGSPAAAGGSSMAADDTTASGMASEPSAPATPPTMATAMTEDSSMASDMGERSMDDLLNSALGGRPSRDGTMTEMAEARATMASQDDSSLPESPSRSVVTRVLGGLMGQMRRCAGDQVGMAMARIRIKNDGSVDQVNISGSPFGGTPQGACMEGVVRRAHFPRFRRASISLTFPFSIRPLN